MHTEEGLSIVVTVAASKTMAVMVAPLAARSLVRRGMTVNNGHAIKALMEPELKLR